MTSAPGVQSLCAQDLDIQLCSHTSLDLEKLSRQTLQTSSSSSESDSSLLFFLVFFTLFFAVCFSSILFFAFLCKDLFFFLLPMLSSQACLWVWQWSAVSAFCRLFSRSCFGMRPESLWWEVFCRCWCSWGWCMVSVMTKHQGRAHDYRRAGEQVRTGQHVCAPFFFHTLITQYVN